MSFTQIKKDSHMFALNSYMKNSSTHSFTQIKSHNFTQKFEGHFQIYYYAIKKVFYLNLNLNLNKGRWWEPKNKTRKWKAIMNPIF